MTGALFRVVVTGSECTGKTTLAQALAERYHTAWSPEYARQFVVEKGAAPEAGDVETIARGQLALEDAAAARSTALVIHDTDLLSTVVYSRHYYGHCPAWIELRLEERLADLYLLAGLDPPWVGDSGQRDRGDRRKEMQALFRGALRSRGARTVEIRGAHPERMAAASRAIDRLLSEAPFPGRREPR